MNTSEQINELAGALAKAQAEMKNATLNKVNPHFKSKYADLAAIRDAVVPILSKHGLSIVQGTTAGGAFLVVTTRLMHSSGQWIQSDYPITNDTNKPQAMGSALTYARRYSLAAMGAIAAEEDDDGNAAQANGNGKDSSLHGDVNTANGNPGVSKANARETYKTYSEEIRAQTTEPGLKKWGLARKPEIQTKLPPEWVGHLEQEYLERMDQIKRGAA